MRGKKQNKQHLSAVKFTLLVLSTSLSLDTAVGYDFKSI